MQECSSCCEYEELIEALQDQLADSEAMQAALLAENEELKQQVGNLYLQLSEKEANWCQSEEKMMQTVNDEKASKFFTHLF